MQCTRIKLPVSLRNDARGEARGLTGHTNGKGNGMKAILTKYLPQTQTKGSRIKAYDLDGNAVTAPYPDVENDRTAHEFIAQCLCEKMGWKGIIGGGAIKNGYAFVFVE